MIGYGTTDSKIVRIPDIEISGNFDDQFEIVTTNENGTQIIIKKECLLNFKIWIERPKITLKNPGFYWGVTQNSLELTTNIQYIDFNHIIFSSYFDGFINATSYKFDKLGILRVHTDGQAIKNLRVEIEVAN